jgi:hypothetical protein
MTGIKEVVLKAEECYKPLYTITRTTSPYADIDKDENKTKDETLMRINDTAANKKFESIHVKPWSEGGLKAFCLHSIYKLVRLIQVSTWFYFFPYVVFFMSYLIPYHFRVLD